MTDGASWIAAMPDAVAGQRALLARLLDEVAGVRGVTGLVLGCSLARGAGDAWSDVDAGLAVEAGSWPGRVTAVERVLRGLGEVVDLLDQPIAFGAGRDARHLFVQYADAPQLSLVVAPADWWGGCAPEQVVLLDTDGSLSRPRRPESLGATPERVREWAFLGWIALADLVKYVARGSAWEALARLDEARTQAWRLWAVGAGLPYPGYGLTAVLDAPEVAPPPGIEATVAGLDAREVVAAAVRLADVLAEASGRAAAATPAAELPEAMAAYVTALLHGADRSVRTGRPPTPPTPAG